MARAYHAFECSIYARIMGGRFIPWDWQGLPGDALPCPVMPGDACFDLDPGLFGIKNGLSVIQN